MIRITLYLLNSLHFLDLPPGTKNSIKSSQASICSHSSSIDERNFGVINALIRATYARTSLFTSSLLTVLFASSTKSLPSRAATISSWAVDHIKWAVGHQIMAGKPGNLIDPKGTATRAEMATMIYRLMSDVIGDRY